MDNWREACHILVTDAQTMGSVGVIRSLGRAGYRVCASSDRSNAIGLRSNYSYRSLNYPSYDANPIAFKDWLYTTIKEEGISAIVPSEGVLLAIRDDYRRLQPLLPFCRDEAIVYRGMSKCDLFENFNSPSLKTRLPPFILLHPDSQPPTNEQLAQLGMPLFIKADATHASGVGDSVVKRCTNVSEAQTVLHQLLSNYRRVLIQGYAKGIGVGAFLLRWNGKILCRFMHHRLHEVPHTGGASSYRKAWWHDAIFQDALLRIEALEWDGVAMFEYRWDPLTDDFRLIEFNGRFWGSLHLALFAGADFPRLLLDAFYGHEEVCETFDLRTRSRWTFPREVEYVWSCLKDSSLPLAGRVKSILEFVLLGLNPSVRSDLNFPQDRMLYMHGITQALARWTRH